MTDLPTAPAIPVTQVESTQVDPAAPIATAPAVDPHAVVTSVVQTVQASPDIHPSKEASVIAEILAGLYQASPAIFAVTRASDRTQAGVGLGLGLAQIILGAFLHRAA